MALSIAGMMIAFGISLPPIAGAVFQEVVDLGAVLNALRAALPGEELSDYSSGFPESATADRSIPLVADA